MSGDIHPLPQYAFMAWCLVKKHRDNFTFTFTVHNYGVGLLSSSKRNPRSVASNRCITLLPGTVMSQGTATATHFVALISFGVLAIPV
jgi:hypothetical protein